MMLNIQILLFVFASGSSRSVGSDSLSLEFENGSENVKVDTRLDVPQIITKYGYPVETHHVITSDGYILTLHRIPYGREGPSLKRPIVFLQHGLLQSSSSWVISGIDRGLAFYLADSGYDVWMGNSRGNRYSRAHILLNPNKDGNFWDFSWHEIGIIDVPEMIDFILHRTGDKKVFYIGHGQGTTVFYVMCSERPEYNDNIIAHFSISPAAYMGEITSPLMKLLSSIPGAELPFELIGRYEFLPTDEFLANLTEPFCGIIPRTRQLCKNSLIAICGFNEKQMDITLLPLIMAHTPAGASTKQIIHYVQEVKSGKFRQYDYGFSENRKRYGSLRPPQYDLNKITAPIYLMYSQNDWLSHEKDVTKFYKKLRNVKTKLLMSVRDSDFNYLDFTFGIDARKLIYRTIRNLMKKY